MQEDDPDVIDVLRYLRQREIVHYQRFAEGIEMVKEYTNMDQLRGQVRRQKALDLIVANAAIAKPEKKTTKKAAKKTEEAVEGEEKDAE